MDYRRIFVDGSAIFITLVTSKRRKILLENIDLLREAFNRAIQVYNFEIIAMCVLPDHLHMLIKPYEIKDYPNIVKQIKTFFSAKIKKEYLFDYDVSSSKLRKKNVMFGKDAIGNIQYGLNLIFIVILIIFI